MCDSRPYLESEGLEVFGHQPARAEFAVRELRVLVEVTAPGDDTLFDVPRAFVEGREQRLFGRRSGDGRDADQGDQESDP